MTSSDTSTNDPVDNAVASFRSQWRGLPEGARAPILVVALVEFGMKVAMWISLARRPDRRVRGPKWAWFSASLINFFGPAAYWAFGRR